MRWEVVVDSALRICIHFLTEIHMKIQQIANISLVLALHICV